MFKSYTRKASAVVGATRAGLEAAAVVQQDGKWGFFIPEQKDSGGGQKLPRLNSGSSGGAKLAGPPALSAENILHIANSGVEALAASTVKMLGTVNSTLTDIKSLIFEENKREEEEDNAAKLRKLEADREKGSAKKAAPGILDKFKDRADGLLKVLRMLALPLFLGALVGLDKKLKFLQKTREKLSKWAGELQGELDKIAELPLFKNNILGTGIRNLLPIAGAFGAFALWKPGIAIKMLQGVGKFLGFFGKNPAIRGLSKLPSLLPALESFGKFGPILGKIARIGGKIFLPITIITSLWETVKGAIDGWEKGGIGGALKGALDGLVHGLIGGLVETISQGIGWVLEQFGVEAEGFKNFKFGTFLEELGSNLGMFVFDLVDSIKVMFKEAVSGLTDIFASDSSFIEKMMQLISFPLTFVVKKFKEIFGGLSPIEMVKKVLSFGTANNAIARAAVSASQPPPAPPAKKQPVIHIIDPSNPESMKIRPPSRAVPQAGISSLVTGEKGSLVKGTYEAFRRAGFSESGARALTAEVGRENDFNAQHVFGTHVDPHNKAVNAGFFSWQGDRSKKLLAYLGERGLLDKNGKIMQNQQSLDAMAQFAKMEMQTGQGGVRNGKELASLLTRNDVDESTLRQRLGQDYIKWRINDPKYRAGGLRRLDRWGNAVDMVAVPKVASGSSLAATTEAVNEAKAAKAGSGGNVTVAPVNASRTNVSNQTQNQLPNLSASTPVEFAPHVV